jgi:hypothetical protein
MRLRRLAGVALFLLLTGLLQAGPAVAQGGGDVNEEVRRAVERAVGASVSTSVAESLSRSIVSEAQRQKENTTIFFSPFYNRTDGDFDFASFTADTGGGTIGFLQRVNDAVLFHAAFAGAFTKAKAEVDGETFKTETNFLDFRLGADLVFLNLDVVKAWFTLEGGVSRFDSNVEDFDALWAYRIAPSVTGSFRVFGPILFEPTVGFAFSRVFSGLPDEAPDADTVITFNPSFSLKYRGEKLRPQLNFAYSKVLAPKDISRNEDGVISVGPEILYAISPNILVGAAYSYSTPLTKDVNVDSHTATLEFRWIF